LQDETEYTKQFLKGRLKHLKAFRKQIREATAPIVCKPPAHLQVWWPYEYWAEPSEVDPDDQAFYRKNLKDPNSRPQLLVDTGTLEDDYGQTGVGGIKLSPCQRYLAMLTEFEKGSESYTIHILDLDEEKVLEDEIIHPDISGCEWSSDSKKLIYTSHDSKNRPNKVWVHVMGTSIKEDQCLLEETDSKFYLHVGTTKSRDFMVVTAASKMSSEVHLLPGLAAMPYQLRLVQRREAGLEYFVECWKDQLIILANNTVSGNYALYTACVTKPQKPHWNALIDDNDDFVIEDLEMNRQKCMLLIRTFRGQGLKVVDMETERREPVDVPLPGWCRQITLGANLDFYSDNFCFFASSPIHKTEAFEYNFTTKQCLSDPSDEESGPFLSNSYVCKTEMATASDGTMVPVTIAHKKGIELDGNNPCLFEVYGAYGHALDLGFQPHRTPLLANGWILAFGHVRGGGEFGRMWHKVGRLEKKQNSISDCEAVMEHLMSQGYTKAGQIVLESFSAGGVVAGAMINKHPNLLLAAILQVPFVDVLTVLTDERQPLTVHEYEEWGNPNNPSDFARIKDLCPYQNIRPNCYPNIFVSCGFNDSRVPAWGPAKWVARMKENQEGDKKIFLHTDFEGGHFSSESERNALRDLQYSLLMYLWEEHCQTKSQKQQQAA